MTIKKIFHLWDKHTVGCWRVLLLLLFLTPFSRTYETLYDSTVLLLWLVIKTGYAKGWNKEDDNND